MTTALIGRAHPIAVLRTEIGRASDSHGGLVLVTGEAGIGKTSLVTEAAREARRHDALVLSGTCWDSDSAPGYWPWVQILRALRRAVGGEWDAVEAAAGGRLGALLGEDPGLRTLAPADAQEPTDAFPLYDAVTTALVTAAQRRPLVVVLDDLHWADPATVRLLAFAAQHTWYERILLIGAYRDAEVEAPEHPLRPLLLPLASRASATLRLTGLDRDGVAALIALFAGGEPEDKLVDEVHRSSGGNPFFIEQTVRNWLGDGPDLPAPPGSTLAGSGPGIGSGIGTGAAVGIGGPPGATVTPGSIAPGVREAVRRRLAPLPEQVVDLLRTASVIGPEFHRPALATATGIPVPHADRLLARAVAAQLIVAHGGGTFTFAHDLVRETLYEELDERQRQVRHAAVVRLADDCTGVREGIVLTELSRHAYLAGEQIPAEQRISLLVAAGGDASGRLATEEAVGHYRRALEIASGDPGPYALICLNLATELRQGGDPARSWRMLERAADHARLAGDTALIARVAITLHQYDSGAAGPLGASRLTLTLLREAYAALVPAPEARTETAAGGPAPVSPSSEEMAHELALRLTDTARRTGDDDLFSFALWARHDGIWGLGTAKERLSLTDEMEVVAQRTRNREMELHASSMRWVSLLELGDPRYYDQHREFAALVERMGMRRFELARAMDNSLVAAFTGRFDEAFRSLAEFGAIECHNLSYSYVATYIRWSMLILRGRFDEARAEVGRMTATDHPFPQLVIGVTAAESGDAPLALRMHDELAALPMPLPRQYTALWMRLSAQAAAVSGDPTRLEAARTALAPWSGQWIVAFYGCDLGGPVDLWLGLVEAARGDREAAVATLTSAWRDADRMRAGPWSVRARSALLGVLGQDAPDGLAAQLRRDAQELGLTHLLPPPDGDRGGDGGSGASGPAGVSPETTGGEFSGSTARSAAPGAPAASPASPAPPTSPGARFRRDGAVWELVFAGRSAHVPDAKGLLDLRTLLAHTGRDVPAVRLLSPDGGAAVIAARGLGADPVLDDRAKSRYRARLEQLDEEIDRATDRGDEVRAAEFARERKALLDELRTAAGLGGRTRRLGDEAERARKTVTARIRDTLRRLDRLHPELAAHLRESLTTGLHCSYRPATPVSWQL
ncbi:AAA family ATPase [Streptomyces qinzhouensis]|uniref:AAA family ATPase n=1 Tax=Streptomyces qinzhouensis TaxID=2599401 RepID=A0A5B8II03_9ACTN|nr:AAA family ATPase [Streptomyces qinzhouensis]QDY77942.1 AAA family ATPase [Streptomyces qinzhouensis]